jgi:hypothetical protein
MRPKKKPAERKDSVIKIRVTDGWARRWRSRPIP